MSQNKQDQESDLAAITKTVEPINEAKIAKGKSRKSSKLVSNFVFSPFFNVAALVLLLLTVFSGLRYLSARKPPAQVSFVEQAGFDAPENGEAETHDFRPPEIFKGEVYSTSIRLRETGALGMAITLVVFAEFAEKQRVPENLDIIWLAIKNRKLMPPGIVFENGDLRSPAGSFVVRYQSQPLRYEILSFPKQNNPSPALLLRFPLTSLDDKTITFYQSSSTAHFEVPAPFARLDEIVTAGWTLEQWRGELLPKNENALQSLEEEKQLWSELPGKH